MSDMNKAYEYAVGDEVIVTYGENIDEEFRGRHGVVKSIDPKSDQPLNVKFPGDNNGPYGFALDEVGPARRRF
jgi:hypothetical protein